MTKKYVINPQRSLIAGATVLFCAIIATTMIYIGRTGSAVIFYLIAALFIKPFLDNFGTVTVTPDYVSMKILYKPELKMTWDEIKEVGLAGEAVLNMGKSDRPGTIYFYFSDTELTDQDLFEMMFHFPPTDKIYLTWDKYRMDFIQPMYGHKIRRYNTGDKKL